jgi:uncharacterized protein (DUF305 family)
MPLTPTPETPGRLRRGTLGIVLMAMLAACGCGRALTRTPADDSPEAGFARDMATHHAQAVEMAFVIRDASQDERLRALAYDIIVTQATQRGVFMGWLQQWGLGQASAGPRMAWMASAPGMQGMPHGSDGSMLMPGMASPAELALLRAATGTDAEVLFLQLMIRHHEGGVHMARAVVAQSKREEVVTMARSIDETQAAEIAAMRSMLAERGRSK